MLLLERSNSINPNATTLALGSLFLEVSVSLISHPLSFLEVYHVGAQDLDTGLLVPCRLSQTRNMPSDFLVPTLEKFIDNFEEDLGFCCCGYFATGS
jgi:hypothetical protein